MFTVNVPLGIDSSTPYPAETSTTIVPPIQPKKRLPVGNDFKDVITQNMIYVDKTEIIHTMINQEKYVFLSRPPRFGKSLLVSTLRYLFEGGAELFKGLKIKETCGYQFLKYTVLLFDFSRLAYNTLIRFTASLQDSVRFHLRANGIDEQRCVDEMEPKECLDVLLRTLSAKKTESRIVVLIDEYDDPWRNFDGNEEDRKEMLKILRGFFKILKSYNLRFCFVTGSTKIALTEFFSGYNCAKDISWLSEYETIVGFSQDELKTYFHEYAEDQAMYRGISVEDIYQLLDRRFEGYRFSQRDENMYNSVDVIDFFANKKDSDITTYHAKTDSKYVVDVIRNVPQITILLDLMDKLKTEDDTIPVGVGFLRGFKESFPASQAALKVLYEGGYLSVKRHELVGPEDGIYYIGFTNQVTRKHYHEVLMTAFKEHREQSCLRSMELISRTDPGFREPLEQDDIISFLKRVRTFFTGVPHLLFPEEETLVESFFQLILYFGMVLSGMQTNWEVILATGRLDVRATTPETSYIFELKRKSNDKWKDTMKQCNGYTHQECFRNRKIVCIGIVFEDEPTESKRVIHAWGKFEKSSDGFFLPGQDSLNMNEYVIEGEPEITTLGPKLKKTKCDRCAKDFSDETAFIEHLKEYHKLDPEFIKSNLVCPHCWKPFGNRGGLTQHVAAKHHPSPPNTNPK